jgi:phosphoglycerol transferase
MTELRRSIIMYVVAMIATGLVLTFSLELWRADLHVPFVYEKDALCMQLWTKGLFENGWYLRNKSVGAPFSLDMYDFHLSDSLILFILKGFCLAASDYIIALNLYYLSTYFLTTLSAICVFRHFNLSRGPAVVGALLFSFLPYHLFCAERHLFLGSYYLVPFAVMLVLWILKEGEHLGRSRTVAGIIIGLLLGSAGVYYAFFTCFLVMIAASCSGWRRRSIRPFGAAAVMIGAISLSVLGNLAPKFAYDLRHGANPEAVTRSIDAIEPLSLKVAPMVLPVAGHRLPALAKLRDRYDAANPNAVGHGESTVALGVIASLGFIALIGAVFFRRPSDDPTLFDSLSRLNLAALLLAMTGGIGLFFGLLVSPMIRAYRRICIFNGFFSLFAVVMVLGWLLRRMRPGWPRMTFHVGLVALAVVGLLDQTTPGMIPNYESLAQNYREQTSYVVKIEAVLPKKTMVFQLPMARFPEEAAPGKIGAYELLIPYLHSKSLRWTYPAMKGRYAAHWQEQIAVQPTETMLKTLGFAGFGGILVDRLGYDDSGSAIESQISRCLTVKPIVSPDRRYAFFNMMPYADELARGRSPQELSEHREAALRPVAATWGKGFHSRESTPEGTYWRWCEGRGEIVLTNPSSKIRRLQMLMTLETLPLKPLQVSLKHPEGTSAYSVSCPGVDVEQWLEVPPGTTTLHLGTEQVIEPYANDSRLLAFRVLKYRLIDPSLATEPSTARLPSDVRR